MVRVTVRVRNSVWDSMEWGDIRVRVRVRGLG